MKKNNKINPIWALIMAVLGLNLALTIILVLQRPPAPAAQWVEVEFVFRVISDHPEVRVYQEQGEVSTNGNGTYTLRAGHKVVVCLYYEGGPTARYHGVAARSSQRLDTFNTTHVESCP